MPAAAKIVSTRVLEEAFELGAIERAEAPDGGAGPIPARTRNSGRCPTLRTELTASRELRSADGASVRRVIDDLNFNLDRQPAFSTEAPTRINRPSTTWTFS